MRALGHGLFQPRHVGQRGRLVEDPPQDAQEDAQQNRNADRLVQLVQLELQASSQGQMGHVMAKPMPISARRPMAISQCSTITTPV